MAAPISFSLDGEQVHLVPDVELRRWKNPAPAHLQRLLDRPGNVEKIRTSLGLDAAVPAADVIAALALTLEDGLALFFVQPPTNRPLSEARSTSLRELLLPTDDDDPRPVPQRPQPGQRPESTQTFVSVTVVDDAGEAADGDYVLSSVRGPSEGALADAPARVDDIPAGSVANLAFEYVVLRPRSGADPAGDQPRGTDDPLQPGDPAVPSDGPTSPTRPAGTDTTAVTVSLVDEDGQPMEGVFIFEGERVALGAGEQLDLPDGTHRVGLENVMPAGEEGEA